MALLLIISAFLLACSLVAAANSDPNTAAWAAENHTHIYRHLSTKTPYRLVANRADTRPPPFIANGCQPRRLWSMIRHGTRYPKQRILDEMCNVERGRLGEIREAIVKAKEAPISRAARAVLRQWPSADSETMRMRQPGTRGKDLADEGWTEMLELAQRMQLRWPDVLQKGYRNESFLFKFTKSQRTEKSFQAFATGLFGTKNTTNIWHPEPSTADPILRFYTSCARWKRDKKLKIATTQSLDDDLHRNRTYDHILSQFTRYGLPNMTRSDMLLMHDVCIFESSWQPEHPSPWCAVFNAEQMRAIDFERDHLYYHRDGYAKPLTYRQACPALTDMLAKLTDETGPPATFYFTHSGTMLKMLAMLGLYRDAEPMRMRDLSEGNVENRQWKTSRIDAFGSNLAVVLYSCSSDNGGTSSDHLLFHHQERSVRLPGCPSDSDLCPIAQFRSAFAHALGENCRFDEMCSLDDAVSEAALADVGVAEQEHHQHMEL